MAIAEYPGGPADDSAGTDKAWWNGCGQRSTAMATRNSDLGQVTSGLRQVAGNTNKKKHLKHFSFNEGQASVGGRLGAFRHHLGQQMALGPLRNSKSVHMGPPMEKSPSLIMPSSQLEPLPEQRQYPGEVAAPTPHRSRKRTLSSPAGAKDEEFRGRFDSSSGSSGGSSITCNSSSSDSSSKDKPSRSRMTLWHDPPNSSSSKLSPNPDHNRVMMMAAMSQSSISSEQSEIDCPEIGVPYYRGLPECHSDRAGGPSGGSK